VTRAGLVCGCPIQACFWLEWDSDVAFVITSTLRDGYSGVGDAGALTSTHTSNQLQATPPLDGRSYRLRSHTLQPDPHKRVHCVLQFDVVEVLGPEQFLYLEVIDQHAKE